MAEEERVTSIFRKFDLNRNGFIERQELKSVMSTLDAEKWSDSILDLLVSEADADKDGMIDYGELFAWIFAEDPSELVEAVCISAELVAYPMDDLITQELTWARTKPQEVAEILRARRGQYRGKDYFPEDGGGKRCIVTKEGWAVVQDAIEYLEEQAKAPIGGVGLYSRNGLAQAAEDHCADIGQTGTAAHSSSDGTTPAERVRRYGRFADQGECLWYGSEDSDARKIVIDLIVDDGVATRGHRHGVYNPIYDTVGVALGPHKNFGRVVAMEFAREWTEDKDAIALRILSGPVLPDAEEMEKAKAKASTHWDRGVCPICKEPIKGGKVMNIPEAERLLGRGEIHFDCFMCTACGKHLKGVPFKIHDKSFMCSACHAEEFGDKCAACGKGITGAMVKCALGVFHVDCLECSQCSAKIGRKKFSTSGGVITCSSCASGIGRSRPKAAAAPAAATGRSANRSGSPAAGRSAGPAAAAGRGSSPAPASGRRGGAKAAAKPKSMRGARNAADAIAMDYASLDL